MQEFLNVTILAVLQGVAEFLPISSSGHLVILQHILEVPENLRLRLEVFLHAGTLLAVFAFYRQRIGSLLAGLCARDAGVRREAWLSACKIAVSALPAVAVYFVFRYDIEGLVKNARMVGALLMFTGAILLGTRFLPRGGRVAAVDAAEFSFLMSAPLIMGGTLLEFAKGEVGTGGLSWGVLAWGVGLSAVVGYFSLVVLLRALKSRWFWLFGPYCIVAGLLTLIFCK